MKTCPVVALTVLLAGVALPAPASAQQTPPKQETGNTSTDLPGPVTEHELPGGGKEVVRPGVNGPVHEIYGPPVTGGAAPLVTVYTEMPASSTSLNSTAAQGNTGPTVVNELPDGHREVVHPSEFVPGVNVHTVYGRPDANGNRTLIKSFMTPSNPMTAGPYDPDVPQVVGDMHPAPASTAPASNESGAGAPASNGPKPPGDTGKGASSTPPASSNPTPANTPGSAPPKTATPNPNSIPVQTRGLGLPNSAFSSVGGLSTAYTDFPGPTSVQELPGGGKEVVRPGVNGPVHEIYGPPMPGSTDHSLITVYTEMPTSGMSLNSNAAQSNTGQPEVHDYPNGGREVVHPSEFVPGANTHIVYGPPDANGNRTVIKSFLTPSNPMTPGSYDPSVPQVVGDLHPAPASATPGSPGPAPANTPVSPANPASGGLPPSRVPTVPGGIPGGDVINPASGTPGLPSTGTKTADTGPKTPQDSGHQFNWNVPSQQGGAAAGSPANANTGGAGLPPSRVSTLPGGIAGGTVINAGPTPLVMPYNTPPALQPSYIIPSTETELPGGGKEIVRPGLDGPVHEIYGPPMPGSTQHSLITTYTEMPTSGMSLNSNVAQSNTGQPEVHDYPNGGREVVHPSEFVPGANTHTVYGPPDANGNRTVIKSFLTPNTAMTSGSYNPQVPPVVGDLHPAPASTVPVYSNPIAGPFPPGTPKPPSMTLDTEKGTSSTTPASSNPAPTGLPPSRVSTLPGGTPGGDVINPASGTPGVGSNTREGLLKELNPTVPASTTGTPTPGSAPTSRASLMQEMQSTLTPAKTITSGGTNSAALPSNAARTLEEKTPTTTRTTTTPSSTVNRTSNSSINTSRTINTSVVRSSPATQPRPAPVPLKKH